MIAHSPILIPADLPASELIGPKGGRTHVSSQAQTQVPTPNINTFT
jgi:hypothetical protein